jgi:uncharacterized phiE125 gp8 family phage protein
MAVDVGDLYRTSMTLTSPSGGLVNAGTMSLTITLPDATTFPVTPVTPVTTGQYQYDYQTTQPGRHIARWVGTGANPGAYAEAFDVLDSTPRYMISLADAKSQLNITDTASDDELRVYLGAATDVVERVRGEAMVRRTFTEEHEVTYAGGRMALSWTPVVSLTSVVMIDGWVTWDVSRLHLNQTTGVVSTTFQSGLFQLFGRIAVTYVAGYAVIPDSFQLAASMIVNHLWQTQRGNRGAPRVGGGISDTTMVPGFAFAVPNRALELLGTGMPGFA